MSDTLSYNTDVILIGAGIMSASLGVMLKELQPDIRIEIFERLDHAAAKVRMHGIMQVQGIRRFVN